jgi:6-phosphogluconolactonase
MDSGHSQNFKFPIFNFQFALAADGGRAVTSGARQGVRVFADIEEMSRAAAEQVVSLSRGAKASGRIALALSGGTTPGRLYSLLATPTYRDAVDWSSLHLFWADERCVPPDHPSSNFKLVRDALLSQVALPEGNIHRIIGEAGPERAARLYEEDLRSFFGLALFPVFDLILLGVGEDGHTASLFPGAPALRERTRLATAVVVGPQNLSRVSLTLPVINHASQVLILAAGRAKAAIVHEILEGRNPKQYPAGMVKPVGGGVTWMIDQEAASLLSQRGK